VDVCLHHITFIPDELDNSSLADQVSSSNEYEITSIRVQISINLRDHSRVPLIEELSEYWGYARISYNSEDRLELHPSLL
jgi:hypothetical protein